MAQEDNQVQINGTKSLIISGNSGPGCKRSSEGGPGSGRSVLVNNVCGKAIEENTTNFQLKDLNNYVETQKFKLESLDLVKTILKPNDYLMKLDLKDVYYSVPIAQEHRKYLQFKFQGVTYEYQYLPFGLSSAP